MTDRIERQLELPVSPVRVWESLTDPELLAEWLADEVTLELRPGGEASFRNGDELRSGWIEEVVAPAPDSDLDDRGESGRLTFWWAHDGEPASRVELVLSLTDRATTLLRIVETRPLEILDLVGVPLPGHGGVRYGPALVAA
ncbi:MAG TPA: SRPBCC domain-containing protein [Solirubrobacteraceae bacterium]|jgi:uncharacterized protein YndB with AHSA1/START domain